MIHSPALKNITITFPAEAVKDTQVSNFLYENLDKGLVVFVIPDDMNEMSKNLKKTYKVGFLFDLLTLIYPSKGKEDKHKIISEKYHLWFTYRQFHNILEEYVANRNKFLTKRSALNVPN